MNPNDAAKLLAVAAAFDNRKPDATSAQAWALALNGRRFEDCQQAIVEHYQGSTEWIMPAHVISAVKKTRAGRIEDTTTQPPAGLDPDDTGAYSRWLKAELRRVADGLPPTEQPYDATRAIGELRGVVKALPPVSPKPPTKTAEHEGARAAAEAGLRARGEIPVADPLDAPPMRATEPEPASPVTEEANA